MKKLLVATAIILSIAAPALAQTTSGSSIHGSRDRGSASESMQSNSDAGGYDANAQIDNSTTQSIAPSDGRYMGSGYNLSTRPSDDTSETGNQAVGGRAN